MSRQEHRSENNSESRRGQFQSRAGCLLSRLAATVVAAFFGLAVAPAPAARGQDNELQTKHKLKALGSLQVLEDEADFKTKLTDARRLQRQLSYSILQQQGVMTPEKFKQTLDGLRNELNQMRSEMNLATQQMNQIPRFRGRIATTYSQEQYNSLLIYRNQLQAQINQESVWLNQLQSQKADPKAKEKLDAEVRDRREAYHQALLDLRTLADATTQKYDELAKDTEVKKAIEALGKGKRDKPKLGPSHDFLNNVKLLDKLEKAESGSSGDPFAEKPAKRSRSKSRSKSKSASPSTKAAEKPGQS
jgi:hypothetical protein